MEGVCDRGQKGKWREVLRPADYGACDVATVGGEEEAVVVYRGHGEGVNGDTPSMAVRFFDGAGDPEIGSGGAADGVPAGVGQNRKVFCPGVDRESLS